MNSYIVRLIAAGALLFLSVHAHAQQAKLADLGWLAGCWEMRNEQRGLTINEMWMKPTGNAMLGVGRTVKAGKLADFEFLRIVEDASGLAYISRPSANKEDTTFKLKTSTANELVFENLAHDFPQRIIYRSSGDRLAARIEGTMNGKLRGIDFPYSRVKCE
jgi:hypothetical protein